MIRQHLSNEQQEAVNKLTKANYRGVVWMKPGEGKTRIGLALAQECDAKHVFIICPKRAKDSWLEEMEKCEWYTKSNMTMIFSSDGLDKFNDCYPLKSTDILLIDEHYFFSSGKSRRSRLLRKISARFPRRVAFSGTISPAQNNETIYWQLENLNLGYRIANSLTHFRTQYRKSALLQIGNRAFKQFTDIPGSVELIKKKIENITYVYFPNHAERKIREREIKIKLTKEQRDAIKLLKSNYAITLSTGEEEDFKFAIQVINVAYKISNGYYKDKRYDSSKLGKLLELCETLHGSGQKAVIWCSYISDIEFLESILPYRTLRFRGAGFDEATWKKGKIDFVLATIASGASVNYFKDVEYAIYYSLSYKLVDFYQSKGRHERKSSNHSGACYYYLLSPIDAKVYKLLNSNVANEKQIISALAQEVLDIC